jgi:hypothetical protein
MAIVSTVQQSVSATTADVVQRGSSSPRGVPRLSAASQTNEVLVCLQLTATITCGYLGTFSLAITAPDTT